ncbi:DUF2271 domain-containing protein [Streptomyces sp. 7-21]|jgi:hypothetical protein|uniref:DUF2271 domain-containing protein n=1 Tax=Streptomyces sp. 7-21 TaxID=2802283 RepID=UPI00191F24D2|nr:DUF2271 domain-containing protein [Streptomyces sp. 7-21]MBL1066449.1 DUF2271 domain-containing protein [Streptomyces sp. 7-21]
MTDRTSRLIVPVVVITGVAATAGGTYLYQRLPDAPAATAEERPAPVTRQTMAPQAESLGLVRITYQLHRIPTHASNQIAVWIEDADGAYVTTLFATSFTANGGWDRRPESLPLWRQTSGWESATEEEVRAASRPAQDSGRHTLYWDGTDRNGNPVRPGTYTYRIEGNLLWEDRVLFTGTIQLGSEPDASQAEAVYLPRSAREHPTMVEDVGASFTPGEPLDPDDVTTYTRGS